MSDNKCNISQQLQGLNLITPFVVAMHSRQFNAVPFSPQFVYIHSHLLTAALNTGTAAITQLSQNVQSQNCMCNFMFSESK